MSALLVGLVLTLIGPHDAVVALPAAHFDVLGVRVGHDAFSEARVRLGALDPRFERRLCLAGQDGTKVLVRAGADGVVSEIEILAAGVAAASGESACSPSARVDRTVQTGGGVRLGMTVALVEAFVGARGACRDDLLHFFTANPGSRVARVLDVAFTSGIATRIHARYVVADAAGLNPEPGHPDCARR